MNPTSLIDCKRFSLELEQSFGKEFEPDEILGKVSLITTDDKMNMYIFDSMNIKLMKYRPDGKLLWSLGAKGQGPGDFSWVKSLLFDGDDKLYISNLQGSRVDTYSLDGQFLESIQVESFGPKEIKLFGVTPEKYILGLSTPRRIEAYSNHESKIYVFEFKDRLTLVRSFPVNEELNYEVPIAMHVSPRVSMCDNLIAVTSLQDFSIRYYDQNGVLIRKLSKESPYITRSAFYAEGDASTVAGLGYLKAPILLNNDYELICSFSREGVGDPDLYMKKLAGGKVFNPTMINMIDLFTPQGRIVASIIGESRFPDFGWPITVDLEGALYSYSENPYPRVLKYKVIIE